MDADLRLMLNATPSSMSPVVPVMQPEARWIDVAQAKSDAGDP